MAYVYVPLDLARVPPELRALLHDAGVLPRSLVYVTDSSIRSIARAARNERIVASYHAHRSAGSGKGAAFRRLLSELELTLSPKQLGRIVAAHELACTFCSLPRPASTTWRGRASLYDS